MLPASCFREKECIAAVKEAQAHNGEGLLAMRTVDENSIATERDVFEVA